jgi:hypothetical protein
MAASWDLLLCNGNGVPLAELTTAAGKRLKFGRNRFAEASFTISHKDDAAALLMQAVAAGPMPTLRGYRRSSGAASSALRFNGYLAPFTEDLEEAGQINAVFRSPFGRLYGDGTSGVGRYTAGSILASEQEQGKIAQALIELYGGILAAGAEDTVFKVKSPGYSFAGLSIGSIRTDGIKRSITYPFANVGQAIINLSECVNGFDFDETFIEGGTTLALFNTYTEQGSLKAGVRFEYGPGTLSNIAHVVRTTASPITRVRLIGANGLKAEASNEAAKAKYGDWLYQEQATDVTSQSVLNSRAEGIVSRATGPIKTVAINPDFGVPNCPQPWDDFWLGDTVNFYGLDGAFSENLKVRVNELDLAIDENGYETTSIPDPGNPEHGDPLHTVFKVQA